MSSARWRFLIEDPLLGRVLGHHLPLDGVSVDETISRPGALRGGLPLSSTWATRELIAPGRRAIYALRDDAIQWGGPLWAAPVQLGAEVISVSAEGWLGYWDRRDIWTTRTWTSVDPFVAFRTLVLDAQNDTDGATDLGIDVVWDTPSPPAIPFEVFDHQAKSLGETLRTLASSNSFDMGMEYELGTDSITKRIRLWYPRRGRDLTDGSSHRFEFEYQPDNRPSATNILRRGIDHAASDMETRFRGWAEGADIDRLRWQHLSPRADGYLPLDGAPSWNDVDDTLTLGRLTVEYASRVDHPSRIPAIEVNADASPRWGTYQLGDVVDLDIDDRDFCTFKGPARYIAYSVDTTQDRPTLRFEEP